MLHTHTFRWCPQSEPDCSSPSYIYIHLGGEARAVPPKKTLKSSYRKTEKKRERKKAKHPSTTPPYLTSIKINSQISTTLPPHTTFNLIQIFYLYYFLNSTVNLFNYISYLFYMISAFWTHFAHSGKPAGLCGLSASSKLATARKKKVQPCPSG